MWWCRCLLYEDKAISKVSTNSPRVLRQEAPDSEEMPDEEVERKGKERLLGSI